MALPQRPLGSQGLMASAQGLGCMGMTAFYGGLGTVGLVSESSVDPREVEEQGLETIRAGLEVGVNLLDTAWIYQSSSGATNEALVGKALARFGRDRFIVSTKFGIEYGDDAPKSLGNPEHVRRHCMDSLSRLGTDYIDLYIMHRMDPTTPIETTMEELKRLQTEGKIRYVGLSECTADEIRRAHSVLPLSAIQMEWSLQSRDIEDKVVPVARELGIGIMAYSPLGRGLLTNSINRADLKKGDFRQMLPRFQSNNWEKNKSAAESLAEMAAERNCTASQLALAWVHSQGTDVFPIPGTTKPHRVRENAQAVSVSLHKEDCRVVENIVREVAGERYPEKLMARCHNSR